MNNADKFKQIFNLYATELWAMSEKDFLAWLNAERDIPDTNVGDLISRQALRDTMYHEAFETDSEMQKWDSGCWIRYKMFENAIDAAPAVDSVKHGKWLPKIAMGNLALIECSECGFHYPEVLGTFSFYYCPYCGAKMDKEVGEDA